jgi:integrase
LSGPASGSERCPICALAAAISAQAPSRKSRTGASASLGSAFFFASNLEESEKVCALKESHPCCTLPMPRGPRSSVASPLALAFSSTSISEQPKKARTRFRFSRPVLGGLKLKKLNSAHVQSFYRDRLDAGLSASTVHKMHDILRRGLAQAVKWHLVSQNVADAVKPPRPAPKEIRALSADETRRMLETAVGDRLEALYVLAVHTGMRQGELLALRWQDVNMENAVVSVRRSLTRSGGKVVFGEPKTKKSRRSIRLTPQAVEALRLHLKRQLRDMEILGDRYQDQGLVFTTDTGAPINPSNLRQRSFAPLLKRAGLPHMRFHDLRHTCATLLLSRGVHPKFVQELLGHATIAITLDTYSHVIPSMGDATAKAMEDALA